MIVALILLGLCLAGAIWAWWPRREPLAPLPPVIDTATGRRFDEGRLTAPFDQDDDGPEAA